MPERTDTHASITAQAFRHTVAGLHIGRMHPEPKVGEMHAVLTVGADPGTVEEGVRHRHLHLPYGTPIDVDALSECVSWISRFVFADQRVLVRSEGGLQRPGLVVAATVLDLGGYFYDATTAVHRAHPAALTDFRYLNVLRHLDQQMRGRRSPA